MPSTIARSLSILIFLTATATSATQADEDEELALAKASQNPIANLISLPFENNLRFGEGSKDTEVYDLTLKPIYPTELSDNFLLINRGILSFIHQGGRRPGEGRETGIGDLNYQGFVSSQTRGVVWGIGPSVIFPTATDDRLGSGKWSAGATAVVLAKPGRWLFGFLAQHIWSFEGRSNRDSVNFSSLQYFVNYNFPAGFYFTSNPTMSANWDANSRSRFKVPVGGGLGKIFRFGGRPVDIKARVFSNVIKPDGVGRWQAQLEFKLLFPK